jgi:predicted aspartyl protease
VVGSLLANYPTTDAVSWQPAPGYGIVDRRTATKGCSEQMSASPFLRVLGMLALMFLARCGAAPVADCNLTKIARLPIEVQDQLLVVPAGINGQWVRLVVDTGAERTTISDGAADRLGLPHDPGHATRSMGIGGATTTSDATVDRLVLGGVRFPVDRVAVGSFKLRTERGLNADGLLGADILLGFDLDIDVPGGTLTLYRSRNCPNVRPPWQEASVEITGARTRKDRLLLPFELDNVAGMAILDTGAQHNVVGLDMVRKLGLTEQTMAGDPSVRHRGVGPAITSAHVHRFKLLRIGPITEMSPVLTVLLSDFGVGDALIGEEFLHGRRVWIAFRSRQVFVSSRANER